MELIKSLDGEEKIYSSRYLIFMIFSDNACNALQLKLIIVIFLPISIL